MMFRTTNTVADNSPVSEKETSLWTQLSKAWNQSAETLGEIAFQIRETVPAGRISERLKEIGMPRSSFYFLADRHVYLSSFPKSTREACKSLKVNLAGETTQEVLKSTGLIDAVPAEDAPVSAHKAFAVDVKAALNARPSRPKVHPMQHVADDLTALCVSLYKSIVQNVKGDMREHRTAIYVRSIQGAINGVLAPFAGEYQFDVTQMFDAPYLVRVGEETKAGPKQVTVRIYPEALQMLADFLASVPETMEVAA